MNVIKLSENNAYLRYWATDWSHKPVNKSYLGLNGVKYHVYESRGIFTWIGYVLKKYFSCGHWQERSIIIGTKQHTFLVETNEALVAMDKEIKKMASEMLDNELPLIRKKSAGLKQAETKTKTEENDRTGLDAALDKAKTNIGETGKGIATAEKSMAELDAAINRLRDVSNGIKEVAEDLKKANTQRMAEPTVRTETEEKTLSEVEEKVLSEAKEKIISGTTKISRLTECGVIVEEADD